MGEKVRRNQRGVQDVTSILDQIANNVPPAVLLSTIEQREQEYEREKLGTEDDTPEKLARKAIAQLPFVRGATVDSSASNKSALYRDVHAHLRDGFPFHKTTVHVVKRDGEISPCKKIISERFDIDPSTEEAKNKLFALKHFFVNGNAQPEDIQESYIRQLNEAFTFDRLLTPHHLVPSDTKRAALDILKQPEHATSDPTHEVRQASMTGDFRYRYVESEGNNTSVILVRLHNTEILKIFGVGQNADEARLAAARNLMAVLSRK